MLNRVQQQIMAILFAAGDAAEIGRIAQALEIEPSTVLRHVSKIRAEIELSGMPFELLRLDDKLQLCTKDEFAAAIRSALELRRNAPLSQAALEVLAIIAYNQPVTKAFVEQVRGVDSAGVVTSLVDKQLIEEAGRLELPGRPISYRTTANFLRCFQLESLDNLPPLPAGGAAQEDTPEEPDSGQDDFMNRPAAPD